MFSNGFKVRSKEGQVIAQVFQKAPKPMMDCVYRRLRYILGENWEFVQTMNTAMEFDYPSIHFVLYLRYAPNVSGMPAGA